MRQACYVHKLSNELTNNISSSRNVTLPETRGTAFAFHTLFDGEFQGRHSFQHNVINFSKTADIGKGLGPLWVSLLIQASGSRVAGFNAALCGWLVCAFIMFLMCFTVIGDVRRLEAATLAAIQRKTSRNPNVAVGGIGENDGTTTFGTIQKAGDVEMSERTIRSDPGVIPVSSVFPTPPQTSLPSRPPPPPPMENDIAPAASSDASMPVVIV